MWKLKETESRHWSSSADRTERSNERGMSDRRTSRYPGLDIDLEPEGNSHESALAKYKRETHHQTGGNAFSDRGDFRPCAQELSRNNERQVIL